MRVTTRTAHSLSATILGNQVSARSLPRVTPRQHSAPKQQLVTLLLALSLVAASAAVVAAHPGDLDPSFGAGGKVTTAFGTINDQAKAVAVQADGKIVAAGTRDRHPAPLRARALQPGRQPRHRPSARRQGDHRLRPGARTRPRRRRPGRRQDRGGGHASTGTNDDFALARYNPDGSLDTTFDSDGRSPPPSAGHGLALKPSRCSPTARSWWRAGSSIGTNLRLRAGALQPRRQPRHHLRQRRQGD